MGNNTKEKKIGQKHKKNQSETQKNGWKQKKKKNWPETQKNQSETQINGWKQKNRLEIATEGKKSKTIASGGARGLRGGASESRRNLEGSCTEYYLVPSLLFSAVLYIYTCSSDVENVEHTSKDH
jgi:hypothetical protein